jgi:5,10-methylene-tetrahydrofolate dehydrogenase/methenyl tetrahydrofolate cyclohydrolase
MTDTAPATLIDGKARAAALRADIATRVAPFRAATGRAPGLAVVLVGEDAASAVYVRSKGKATREAGMESFEHRLPADTTSDALLDLVVRLNADPAVDGILVQLPLPGHIDTQAVLLAIDPDKDVDGFHPVNAGRLAIGAEGFVPCTPLGCLLLLRDIHTRSSAGRTSSASRWRNCCSSRAAPSPSRTAGRATSPITSAARTSWSPRWASPASSRATGSSPARA